MILVAGLSAAGLVMWLALGVVAGRRLRSYYREFPGGWSNDDEMITRILVVCGPLFLIAVLLAVNIDKNSGTTPKHSWFG